MTHAYLQGPWLLLLLGLTQPLGAQSTRAERTGYRQTSSYADVTAFLDSLQRLRADLRLDTLGTSAEGRPIPLVIASRPLVADPAAARRGGKPVVYIQGNIHGGEVEGKEAALMLLRDLTVGRLAPLLDSLVLLVVPIYNADGNEHVASGAENRPGQNGPPVVGRRVNGRGLDLNRDYVKMEAPETRGAAALLRAWNPELVVDLHTTNGSHHGYVLTYAPGLSPNDTPATAYVRDRFLPALRERMARRHRQATFLYGNFRNQDPDSLNQGWETYDARPRFGTNWIGLRGRLAVLSEAYSNADFATRVSATYNFAREILSLAAEERATIRSVVRRSDKSRPDSVTVRSALGPPVARDVVAELTEPAGEGDGGYARRRRTGVFRTIRMPVYDRFVAARREARPAAYLFPATLTPIAELLRRHGIVVGRLAERWLGEVERFKIDGVTEGQPFEGHRPVALEGRWGAAQPGQVERGWFLVSTDQPLGLLAAYLLEPASEDGVATWNLLDGSLVVGGESPIVRSRHAVRAGVAVL
ncbi:MAG: succinylglutamate desuccinylase/aspartoacylase family protein, partial [Gemmatimonadales bacterium]|nr:succinylglutamate desuccinylase/aspartoacylase family protein [Gemmatimonadales bacterium]